MFRKANIYSELTGLVLLALVVSGARIASARGRDDRHELDEVEDGERSQLGSEPDGESVRDFVQAVTQDSLLSQYLEHEHDEAADDGEPEGESRFLRDLLAGIARNFVRIARGGGSMTQGAVLGCPREPRSRTGWRRAKMMYHKLNEKAMFTVKETSGGGWREKEFEQLKDRGFRLDRPTIAVMNGWHSRDDSSWLRKYQMLYDKMHADLGLREPAVNLLIFNWTDYAYEIYARSVSYVPHLGKLLAGFFEHLVDKHKYNTSQLHLVSFSLSTHISGLAARQLKAKYGPIAQITALDPTGVCMHEPGSEFARKYELVPSDARLVVSRHYNMHQLGAKYLIGGLDIVVNNGMNQPVMRPNELELEEIIGAVGILLTSHIRSVRHEVGLSELKSDCHEIAYKCSSLESFAAGECGQCGPKNQSCYSVNTLVNLRTGQRPVEIGYKPGTVMYLATGRAQYCARLYQVVVKLVANASEAVTAAFEAGKFSFPVGDFGAIVRPTNAVSDKGRAIFTQLLKPAILLTFTDTVKVEGTSSNSSSSLVESVEFVAIRYLSHLSHDKRRNLSTKYCPDTERKDTLIKCKEEPKKRLGLSKRRKKIRRRKRPTSFS